MRRGLATVLGLTMLMGGCSSAPLGYLQGSGPAARQIASLGWGLIAISVAVTLIVLGLLAYAIWRERPPETQSLGGGDDAAAIRWIGIATGISVIFLFAAAIWTALTVRRVSDTSVPASLVIDVTAHVVGSALPVGHTEPGVCDANDIVIPAGVPIQINLRSADVIHSFCVPNLAGKMDTIPGVTNTLRIQADSPGEYRGQCTEFCGAEHAKMALFVRTLAPTAFQLWRDRQLQDAVAAVSDPGQQAFLTRCAACHAVRGLAAGGILGPDLSHFGERTTIGAGALPNDDKKLAFWINHTQTVKPGSKMPDLDVPADQLSAITAFLEGLK